MDIKSLLKKLDLSSLKVITYTLFNRQALYEYILDKANTGVNLLLEENSEAIQQVRNRLSELNDRLIKLTDYIPAPWLPYAQSVNQSLYNVYMATEDNQITTQEAREAIDSFKLTYSTFKAD